MEPRIFGYDCHDYLGGSPLTCVYAARQLVSGKQVVIKTVRDEWKDTSTAVKLLQREARAGLAVRNQHLVRILEAHVTKPPYFLVMERLYGTSLREWMGKHSHLGVQWSFNILRQVAHGLQALHGKGFLHGDVKPENVLLMKNGFSVLLDLGLAHRPGENIAFLEEGYILGTPSYLAPEAMGFEVPCDFRSDLYSLGVMFYEMLTGRLPLPSGSINETLRLHHERSPVDPRQYIPSLQTPIVHLLSDLLDKRPEKRIASASALIHRLLLLESTEFQHRLSA